MKNLSVANPPTTTKSKSIDWVLEKYTPDELRRADKSKFKEYQKAFEKLLSVSTKGNGKGGNKKKGAPTEFLDIFM